jgi:L-fuculose-phosphate aldolase
MANKYESIKKEIKEKCLLMEKIGFFIGTWGNLSVRIAEGLIVTPSRVRYSELDVNDFVTVSSDGVVISGHRLPSSEAEIHSAVYNKKSDVSAAIHSHSPYATAVSDVLIIFITSPLQWY